MRIGVVSDTHNNLKNIDKIISLFNEIGVESVFHTGDIANSTSLEKFSRLNCKLYGVYGNNDRSETDLDVVVKRNNFLFSNPPVKITKGDRSIVIFHEPDLVEEFLLDNSNIDLVLHGHTHRYRNEVFKETHIFNPGECAGLIKGKNSIGVISVMDPEMEIIKF